MKTEVKKVTPAMAMEILKGNNNNRKLYQRTVMEYSNQMTRGLWRLTGQGISIADNGDVLDGQHRLQAVIESQATIEFMFINGLDKDTFDVYDTGKLRSAGDMFHIAGVINEFNVSAIIGKYFTIRSKSFSLDRNSSKRLGVTKHDYLVKYNENPDFWQNITKCAGRCKSKINLYPISIIGGFFAYLVLEKNHNYKVVEKFMNELFGTEPDSSTSTKLLRDTLFKNSMTPKRYGVSLKFVLLVKTWNNYLYGRNIKRLKFSIDEKYPTIL